MTANKTQPTQASVADFLNAIEELQKRKDSKVICDLMQRITGAEGVLWGTSIIGFGQYRYSYKSGREGDWFLVGFSPRKNALTLYLTCDLSHESLRFEGLGKYKMGKGCLYIKKLDDVDMKVLERLIKDSTALLKEIYS